MMIAAAIYHTIILYLLVDVYDWGIYGCSWGTVITYIINSFVVTIYCGWMRPDLKESFFFPTKECFDNLWDYFKIGLPSSAMISLEWWSFEIQAIMASYMGIIYGGSMVILINTLTVLTMIPFGSQIAGAVFIGNCMGEGKPRKARTYLTLITIYTTISLAFCSTLLEVFKDWVALLFTNAPELLPIVTDNYKYVAIFLVIHGVGMSLGGALRGFGKQSIATKLVFCAFFLVGHPMSALLCFYFGIGLPGITLGFTVGSIAMGLFFYINIVCFSDWEGIAKAVRKRMLDNGHA